MTTAFSINFDYRCPFARNANEHVLAALEGGADYDVRFVGFSLHQAHVKDGDPPVWEQPERRADLSAVASGIVVRERMPEQFPSVHLELFAARHERGEQLNDHDVIAGALRRGGVKPDEVFAELEAGWPYELLRDEHEASVREHAAFGVPTFVLGDRAVFVRLMTRPEGDTATARATIDRVLDLLGEHPELNEFKHTSIPR
jgi:hypothetical protein